MEYGYYVCLDKTSENYVEQIMPRLFGGAKFLKRLPNQGGIIVSDHYDGSKEKSTIGFIGLGLMGFPMCKRLLQGGCRVYAYTTTAEKRKRVEEAGALALDSLGEIVRAAEVIMLCLPDSRAVEEVVYKEEGLFNNLRENTIVIDLGSSDPLSTKRIAKDFKKIQCHLIDAPVSRGVPAAVSGTLSMMVGGEKAVVDKVKDILGNMATDIIYVGQVGSGHIVKCLNNLLAAANMISALEVMLLAKKLGIDTEKCLAVINASSGSSMVTRDHIPKYVLPRGFDSQFALGLMYKDVKTAMSLADSMNMPMHLTSAAKELYATAVQKGMAGGDNTRICNVLEEMAGVVLK